MEQRDEPDHPPRLHQIRHRRRRGDDRARRRRASTAPTTASASASSASAIAATRCFDAFLTHKDCEVVAICDIYQPYLDFASKKIGTNPAQYRDYRKLLEHDGLDAVAIETPDHWHALQMIEACKAGKDVYVEKPLSLCVAEGRKMVEAARQHKRVVQVGIQRLSSSLGKEVAEFLQGGGIGKVTVGAGLPHPERMAEGDRQPADEAEPPKDFDWDAWQGPAPAKPYNMNRTFYRFRWFYDYSGGQLTNFGVHYIASIHWALGLEAPLAVTAIGGKYANYDNREVPDTMEVLWHYPGDTLVTFSQYNASTAPAAARGCEIEFRGTKGTLYLNSNGYEVVPESITPNEFAARDPTDREKEKGWRTGAKAADRGEEGGGQDSRRRPRPQLPRLRQEPQATVVRHRVRPPRHDGARSSPTSRTGPRAISNGTRRPSGSPTTRRRTSC